MVVVFYKVLQTHDLFIRGKFTLTAKKKKCLPPIISQFTPSANVLEPGISPHTHY